MDIAGTSQRHIFHLNKYQWHFVIDIMIYTCSIALLVHCSVINMIKIPYIKENWESNSHVNLE